MPVKGAPRSRPILEHASVMPGRGSYGAPGPAVGVEPSRPSIRNRTVFTRDNLEVLRGMDSASVDLIYLDPPFNSNATYSAPIGSDAAEEAFRDSWTLDDVDVAWHGEIAEREPALYDLISAAGRAHSRGMQAYLVMMSVRMLELRRVLSATGSVYLHCDPTASHYLKAMMDAIWGRDAYRSEIVWRRTSSHNRAKRWGPIHDTILYYGRKGRTWHRTLQPLDPEYVEAKYRHRDDRGQYATDNLTGPGVRSGDTGSAWRGCDPTPKGRHWELPPDRALPDWFSRPDGYADMPARQRLEVLDDQGLIHWPERGSMPCFRRYLTARSGAPVADMVLDIPPLQAHSRERTRYPTQKPLALLERIISASSSEGDLVLDPFCGCATTLIAAERLARRWIGIDLSPVALGIIRERMERDLGGLVAAVIHREDIPPRTDLGPIPDYRTHRHALYGSQEGDCALCAVHFPYRNLTVDHILPRSQGGTDHPSNLQLLCAACNSLKGTASMAEARARLARRDAPGGGRP